MSRTKFQHYVPRFYLENFCDSNGMVWIYDKELDKFYRTKAQNTGGETFFYDVRGNENATGDDQFIEKFLGDIERCAARVLGCWLAKLRKEAYFRIYPQEREVFARFLAIQMVRSPSYRSLAVQGQALMEKLNFKKFLKASHPKLYNVPLEFGVEKAKEPLVHAQSILDLDGWDKCVESLQGHIWTINQKITPMPLVTSDSPVVLHAHKRSAGVPHFTSYKSDGIEITFPLTPEFSLALLDRCFFKKLENFDGRLFNRRLSEADVKFRNSLQIRHSSRFVYSAVEDFTMAKQMCFENPIIRDPDRPRFRTSHDDFQNSGTFRGDALRREL